MENQITPEQKTNSDSVISIILGVVSFIIPVLGFFTAIAGIIFSIKSLRTIKVTNEPGRGLSITGLVCSILAILFYIISVVVLIIIFFFLAADATSGDYYY